MRWTVVLLALTACTRWTTYENGDDLRPELAAALRAQEGGAALVAGGRAYSIRPDALREERRAFTAALADAMEAQRYHIPRDVAVDFRGLNQADVVSFPYPDRRLELAGAVTVQGMRRGPSSLYWVSKEKRERYYLYVEVIGTPAIDRAWQQLARRAEAAAERAIWTPAPLETMHGATEFTRAALIDVREIQGSD
ncbi:MAG: hypothetical protein ACYSUM_11845 [Planctomycetota bacterium]|jgi:hypothetical protein